MKELLGRVEQQMKWIINADYLEIHTYFFLNFNKIYKYPFFALSWNPVSVQNLVMHIYKTSRKLEQLWYILVIESLTLPLLRFLSNYFFILYFNTELSWFPVQYLNKTG